MENNISTIRHSASHVLAMAVLKIFPDAKLAIGPAIENGFYYDFELPRSLTPEDLSEIEKNMLEIKKQQIRFTQSKIEIHEAHKIFTEKSQPYKTELIEELISENKTDVSIYSTGDFIDLCKGPHVENTSQIGEFKLLKIAGAYWKGDEKNIMLQRIYGTGWETKEQLNHYLEVLKEAKKRDHRKLGKDLDLFHIDDQVGLGLPLWHPKGAILWRIIEDFWYKEHLKNGYSLVRTPHIGNRRLWETSGHWGFYNSSMYPPMEASQSLEDKQSGKKVETIEEYLLKPMNCPFHIQIYKNDVHSYRELPFRWAECGTVYRYEKKGELSGLTRVRGFTQDDAHIICRKDQVEDELKKVIDFIFFIYKSFGFQMEDVDIYLSLRDPNQKTKYVGEDEGWEFTENILRKVAKEKNLEFKEEIGEAAFYGPKLDFKIQDVLGREWQCSTLQFDFNLPERFDMTFKNAQMKNERPYVLHRALFGSFERFIGLLIEHYAGNFPIWLAPVQIKIITVSNDLIDDAQKIANQLIDKNIRVIIDNSNETVGKKIRNAELEKIPYILTFGKKEQESGQLAVRINNEVKVYTIESLVEEILQG